MRRGEALWKFACRSPLAREGRVFGRGLSSALEAGARREVGSLRLRGACLRGAGTCRACSEGLARGEHGGGASTGSA